MWTKVRQLTGRSKNRGSANSALSANKLNNHHAAISTDAEYQAPGIKSTVTDQVTTHITEWRIFRILDGLQKTATGLDGIPAWFLEIGAPFFSAAIADAVNLSLATGAVPSQRETACILPVPKVAVPSSPADYRPISITHILSKLTERTVVRDYIYPSFKFPPENLDFSDQFVFQPTTSTTAALIHLYQTITNHLQTNSYVIVYARDFSEALDSVRHKSVLDKFSQLLIPDHNMYNWIEDFRHHSHCTKFGDEMSDFQSILASIIQGSAIGPAAYVVTASDLLPVNQENTMHKYADDTYLVVPAANHQSCSSEIDNLEKWAAENILVLNRKKSVEIVFVASRSRRTIDILPPAVLCTTRVEAIKALGVTISRTFSVTQHVENLLAACAQTSFALRTLRQHGMPTSALQAIFQAIVVAKLSYASSAWWGFASEADRNRLEAFLRRSVRLGYRDPSARSLSDLCELADQKLFTSISNNPSHLLHSLLTPKCSQPYNLRQRTHPFQVPTASSNNFFE